MEGTEYTDLEAVAEQPFSDIPDGFGQPLNDMTDRQILMEIAYQLRSVAEMIAQFQNMGPTDLMKMFMGGKR